MCGILGYFGESALEDHIIFRKAFKELEHRGPDGSGVGVLQNNTFKYTLAPELNSHVIFSHKRLSIIDINGGAQPMFDADDRFMLVFNGEIFNYRILRSEITKKYGIVFRTSSDSEVLLYGLIHEGVMFLHRCNGMWAFLFYNRLKDEVIAARDRYGIKPLYFTSNAHSIYWSSEIKSLLHFCSSAPNQQTIDFFRKTGISNHCEETLFENILQLQPGEWMRVSRINKIIDIQKQKWYSLSLSSLDELSYEDCKKQYARLISASIGLRLESDVEVGALLSGGIDSSIVVKNAICQSPQSIFQTFSGISSNPEYSEHRWVNALIKSDPRLRGNFIAMEDSVSIDEIDSVIRCQEAPFSTSSLISQNRLFRAIQPSGLKVILDGQGSDEINLGYDKYFRYAILQMIKKGKWRTAGRYAMDLFQYRSAIHALAFIFNSFAPETIAEWFKDLFGFARPSEIREMIYVSNHMSLFEFEKMIIEKLMLPNHLLYLDKNSMQYSIEARSPFLDHELVEFSLSLSAHQRLFKGRRKGLLIESQKHLLPSEIYNRKNKIGFRSDDGRILQELNLPFNSFRAYTIERWHQLFF